MDIWEGLFGGLFSDPNEDDYMLLPEHLREAYLNPEKILGLKRDVSERKDIRNSFRRLALLHNDSFIGLPSCKRTWEEVLFAYRLLTGELCGPTKALSTILDTSPLLFGIKPHHLLCTLRPIGGGPGINQCSRACAFLAVKCTKGERRFEPIFVIEVSYYMRTHSIRRTHAEFIALKSALDKELVLLPVVPNQGFSSKLITPNGIQEIVEEICRFIQNTHRLLSHRGVFSPRVMSFLGVDYGRVHMEEEGRIIQDNLDSTNLLPNTCWQVVSSNWIMKWRKFMQGRGARRYLPPGPINNYNLVMALQRENGIPPPEQQKPNMTRIDKNALQNQKLQKLLQPQQQQQQNLPPGGHKNVRRFILGGPRIGRSRKDLYSNIAIAKPHAIILAQAITRGFLARRRYADCFFHRLAMEHVGAKELLYEQTLAGAIQGADERVAEARNLRNKRKEVFDQVGSNNISIAMPRQNVNSSLVVAELQEIITIGGAEEYSVEFDRKDGLSLGFGRLGQSASEFKRRNEISKLTAMKMMNFLREKDNNREKPEITFITEAPNPEYGSNTNVIVGSILLSVNDYPVSTLSYDKTIKLIKDAAWPIHLCFRRPLGEADVMSLEAIALMWMDHRVTSDITLGHLKRRLVAGIPVCRLNSKGNTALWQYHRIATTLSLDEAHLFCGSAELMKGNKKRRMSESTGNNEMKQNQGTQVISLYDVRHTSSGKTTPCLRKAAKGFDEGACFSISIEDNSNKAATGKNDNKILNLALRMGDVTKELKERRNGSTVSQRRPSIGFRRGSLLETGFTPCRNVLIWGLNQIIKEMQINQIYMDKDGMFKTRRQPKQVLRAITRK